MAMPLRQFLVENQPRRIYRPGQVPAYSNYGVGLGGYVVQRVSGQPFEQYVAEHIFQPLGMKRSSFDEPLSKDLSAFVSDGYKESTEAPAIGFEIFNPAPAGGVSSTAADMGRFAQALLNGGELEGHRILKSETLKTMWTRQFAASDAMPAPWEGLLWGILPLGSSLLAIVLMVLIPDRVRAVDNVVTIPSTADEGVYAREARP